MQERCSGTIQGRKNRGTNEIVADVLRFLKEKGPQSKSRIMGYCGLSFWQTKDYLPNMADAELISKTESGHWEITDKGDKFVAAMDDATNLLKQVKA